ncbi:hypothetical protein H0H81_003978 [Sphagnurus paluster]|uniref:Uncharacterized protein n=1 Tax=Sphagnurus paluster TaxID=117069 RepID=A0A9P7FRS7_9AGAR|nr:hypothetical protein H0H81_003978 [Sphagnurus paluster]
MQLRGSYECLVCETTLKTKWIACHEESTAHLLAIRRYEKSKAAGTGTTAGPSGISLPDVQALLSVLLDELQLVQFWEDWVDPRTGISSSIDWEMANMDTQIQLSLGSHVMQEMAEKTREYLLCPEGIDGDSDSEQDEHSNDDRNPQLAPNDSYVQFNTRSKRQVTDDPSNPYFPWPDRQTCVLDILRHIPHSAFSQKQNETIHWAMQVLGVADLPSDRTMDDINRALQDLCGIESLRYDGALGHIYYSNDLAGILAQEMANPRVWKHLHFYLEDAGNHLSETWQAERWKDELDSSLTTPMIRLHHQDFYIDEICLLRKGACMPRRWFTWGKAMFACAWHTYPTETGWIVDTSQEIEIAASDLVLASSGLQEGHTRHNLPSPTVIIAPPLEMLDGIIDQLE